MLPQHLIVDFWNTVRRELRERYGLSEGDTTEAVSGYRAALDRHYVDDWIYHRDAERVAETVAGGWRTGFPDPVVETSV